MSGLMDPEAFDEALGTGGFARVFPSAGPLLIEDHTDDVGPHIAQSLEGFR